MHDQPSDATPLESKHQKSPAILVLSRDAFLREDVAQAIADAREGGFDFDVYPTRSLDETRAIIAEHAQDENVTLIAGGGDGMLNAAVRVVDEQGSRGSCLGIMPLGTANDLATAAGIPCDDLAGALRIAIAGKAAHVDLAYVNDRPFLNAVTLGTPAQFSQDLDPKLKARYGRWAYLLSSLKQLAEIECAEVEVVAGDFRWSGPCFGVMVGNGRQVGGGFEFSSASMLNDGLLDGMVVPEMPMRQWAGLAMKMRRDDAAPELDSQIPSWRSGETVVRFARPQAVQIDGEPGDTEVARFRVDPRRLRLRLPGDCGLIQVEPNEQPGSC